MATKSPTTSVRSREMIGVDQFSQRREVFDKHDSIFVPLPSPTAVAPVYKDVEPIVTSNHGKTTTNFKRNTAGYSSMRETRSEDRNHFDFRPRKYSDNFTSELNQGDDVEYRHTMTERTRRVSKLRREFLNSNLHEPNESTLTRSGVRASMPVKNTSPIKYKIESPNLYKFPFAEPYSTPTPTRKVIVDFGDVDKDDLPDGKENQDPAVKPRHKSLSNAGSPNKIDHHKLFEELVKRYSPQRQTIDWTLPPTRPRPRVVGSVPKSTSSVADSIDVSKTSSERIDNVESDDVFDKKPDVTDNPTKTTETETPTDIEKHKETEKLTEIEIKELKPKVEVIQNGPEYKDVNEGPSQETTKVNESLTQEKAKVNDSNASLIAAEANDRVPELFNIIEPIPSGKMHPIDTITDMSIPEMIEKMTAEGDTQKKDVKKVKRKRSFLDKLLGRNKGEKK